ncbi:MAG: DUF484 family protein [Kiloniellales bacterium]|jgi:uncharacterized protein YigA (DUF484 family)
MTQRHSDGAPERASAESAVQRALDDELPAADQVVAYLRRHPNFLTDHPEVLEILSSPASDRGDRVVDLQLFLVERLRSQLAEVNQAHDNLVAVGRLNMAVQARVHRATLALLSARSFEQLIETVTTDLAVILDLDAVALGVEQATEELPPVRLGGLVQLELGTVDDVIGRGRSVTLVKTTKSQATLFGAASSLIRSQALIRLSVSRKTPPALLALGSRRPEQFREGQRTELLTFLARALERCIRTWLKLPD